MGEDIHFRCYVKSKKTGNYINAHDICSWDPKYSLFKELASERNYDFFSLFGSRRGDYKELDYSNYGIPDFLKGSVFEDYCRECGYYGFVWFKLPDLIKATTEYSVKLKDPSKYLDPDSDEYADWEDLKKSLVEETDGTEKFIKKYNEWLNEHSNILDQLSKISGILAEYTETAGSDTVYSKLLDLDETVFLFFFDS